jgi:hypothetical protein
VSLVNIDVPSLHNGVSQQTPAVRAPEQLELQVNGWSSLADGLQKRAPSSYVAKLLAGAAIPTKVYHINRDTSERYIVVAQGGQLRVFGMNGAEYPVLAPAGWGYLSSAADPEQDIVMTTVADYTFVVNRKATPAMVTFDPGSGDPPPETIPPPSYYIPPNSNGWDENVYEP